MNRTVFYRAWILAGSFAFAISAGPSAYAAGAGSPDPTFGGGGFVQTGLGTPEQPTLDSGSDLALDRDGNIVVAGVTSLPLPAPSYQVVVLRYRSDGTLDPDFGTAGITIVGLSASATIGGVALDSQGRIVVDAAAAGGGAVIRLLPDGSLDPAFGGTGVVTFSAPGHTFLEVRALLIVAGDEPLVIGDAVDPSDGDGDAMLARFLDDGTPDPGFGAGGFAFLSRPQRSLALFVAARGGSSTIAAAGWVTRDGGSPRASVFRFTSDGRQDHTFSGNGTASYAMGAGMTIEPTGIAVRRADGEVYVDSWNTGGPHWKIGLAAFTGAGSLDGAFGDGTGKRTYDPTPFSDIAMGLLRQHDGSLVISGGVAEGSSLLMRVSATGVPDPGFGTDGVATNPSPGGSFAAVRIDPVGRIVAAGAASHDILVARFLG